MSKVKIQGHASGTGVLTVTAPNTSTDRTITLPDGTGTLIADDGSGNVGIGVTPETWESGFRSIQLGGLGSWVASTGQTAGSWNSQMNNVYRDSAWKYIVTDEAVLYQQLNGTHTFFVAPSGAADSEISWTTAMTIDNSGDVEIGQFSTSGATAGYRWSQNGLMDSSANGTDSVQHTRYYNDNGQVGAIRTSGSSTSYNTSSDYRLKENVKPMSASIDRLKELKPVNFAWKVDGSRVDGFLAHEAQEVVPEAITGTKDAMTTEEYEVEPAIEATYDEEGNELTPAVEAVMGEKEVEDYQGIDQGKLVPLLTSALQEAVAKIEELTTRIETLENA